MKKICVDKEKCIGCGACESIEPEIFELNDEGLSTVLKDDYDKLSDELKESAEDAASSCPTEAISIKETEE